MNASLPTTPDGTASSIHARAVLVYFHASSWIARKLDPQASRHVESHYGATRGSGTAIKKLLPGEATVYQAIVTLIGEVRSWHKAHTLAWGNNDGWRLLPTKEFTEYSLWMRGKIAEFDRLCDTFAKDYPRLVEQAKAALNGWWQDRDYPSPDAIRGKFAIQLEFAPLPATGDLRLDLGADQIAAIEANVKDRLTEAVQGAVKDAWERLHGVVAKVAERCTDEGGTAADGKRGQKIFRDTLIENVVEVCDTLRRLNVTDDPDLEAMRARVEKDLARIEPADLRDDASLRKVTADKANDILDAMSGFYAAGE